MSLRGFKREHHGDRGLHINWLSISIFGLYCHFLTAFSADFARRASPILRNGIAARFVPHPGSSANGLDAAECYVETLTLTSGHQDRDEKPRSNFSENTNIGKEKIYASEKRKGTLRDVAQ